MLEPPKNIPTELLDEFTMNGTIPVYFRYKNQIGNGEPLHYDEQLIEKYMDKAKTRSTNYYGRTDTWFYQALDAFPIDGKTTVVIGSASPFYECVCLSRGASVSAIEYRKIECDDKRIRYMTPSEYEWDNSRFQIGVSISTYEHDGLGRYGDPINPNGDLEAMQNMKEVIEPNGILFLGIPIENTDSLVWNHHRIYGPKRLPLLLKGWTVIKTYGLGNEFTGEQPLLVLKNS
jgi:hypothetical protein